MRPRVVDPDGVVAAARVDTPSVARQATPLRPNWGPSICRSVPAGRASRRWLPSLHCVALGSPARKSVDLLAVSWAAELRSKAPAAVGFKRSFGQFLIAIERQLARAQRGRQAKFCIIVPRVLSAPPRNVRISSLLPVHAPTKTPRLHPREVTGYASRFVFRCFRLVVPGAKAATGARSARAAPAMGPMPGRRRLAALALALGAQANKRPNLLLALVDDLGSGDVQYNDPTMVTPELSSLAEDGVILDRFYAAATCTPARAALMTGRLGIRTGMQDSVIHATEPRGVPLDEVFLGEKLQQAGYRTAMVGKWHLGLRGGYTPLKRGFEKWRHLPGGGSHTGHFSVSQPHGGGGTDAPGRV